MATSALFCLGIPSPTSSSLGADALRRRLEPSSWPPGPRRAGGSAIVRVRCEKRDDAFFMRRCVELARKAVGCTSPNPMVGCVVVKDGEIVGRGFHPKAGQPHAEVFALRDAGILAEHATAYVSLEPCNHHGRTPPCTEALIRAKVKQVVVGTVDPNPIVASKGVDRLRASGIDVIVGVEEMLCRKLNEAYIHRMITGRPFVTLRYTLSFNGRILNQLGKGAEGPGGYYSQLLQEYDGIIIPNDLSKISTLPTSHEIGANQPFHIVIAKGSGYSLCLPRLGAGSAAKIIVLAERHIKVEPEMEGIEMVVLEQITLSSILDYCGRRGLCSILLDFAGGSECLSELLEDAVSEHLIQKVVMEICPFWNTRDKTSELDFSYDSLRLKNLESRISNESVLVEGYL
ncbi:Riboflavin biosynthesis protein ribD [Musa troglodytarum]|uniref:Riboflavin biosynthesis protein PYRD, chloroplastic n=1 Tax=Musa troglodytarum TaxID=320322 RepID=A0A9E7FRY3_9LILI|nr:Riboflavin biosynthesis protein ribD [Musa troglodytarum]